MNLENLKQIFADHGCNKIYVKILAANDNSKNQVYFSGSFDILNVLPLSEIKNDTNNWKAKINFNWITEEGKISPAPRSQFILYPQYPEVRFSGFLLGSKNAPSALMSQRIPNRLLFFGVTNNGRVLGFVTGPDSEISNQFNTLQNLNSYGVFKVIELPIVINSRLKLLSELLRIYNLGWIKSKRLDTYGNILPCESSNCGGYTLEAELGLRPNGYSAPDFLDWEIKQFGVSNFLRVNSRPITLMTPEPTDGFYKSDGAEAFIKKYGYLDPIKKDRMNFNGSHYSDLIHKKTSLTLKLVGFDSSQGLITDTNGKIVLLDANGNEAASWSFLSMLKHWNLKHNQACYIPSLFQHINGRNYKYGNIITLGTGTDFQLFLTEVSKGNVYYDPGIKIENMSNKPFIKKRSQFRIKSGNIGNLYTTNEIVDLTKMT